MAKTKRRVVRRRSRARALLSFAFVVLPPLTAASALAALIGLGEIEATLAEKFEGKRWDFPSKIYSDSYAVYPGLVVDSDNFRGRLERLGYRHTDLPPARHGEYRVVRKPYRFEIHLNSFEYPTYRERGRRIHMDLDPQGRVLSMIDTTDRHEIYHFELEPGLLAGLHGDAPEERREMALEEVPSLLVRGVIAVEDRRFFDHAGVDFRSLARAAYVNLRSGEVRQGGSTLTQQLMKNFFLTAERSLSRKLREAALAVVAERRFSKLDILENYLNEIYMGQSGGKAVHGMWEAARHYFGRTPDALDVGQVACLAGMIRAPNYYSPHRHPERARARRDVVLGLLREQDEIGQELYETALSQPLDTVPPPKVAVRAPYFVDFVRDELLDRYSGDVLTSEGYRIFTTLDPELQLLAERVVRENLAEIEADIGPALEASGGQRLEAALVAVHPRSGAIRAMIGGRDYATSQYNRATDSRRQPGSTFKPIVMLAALGSERVGDAHFLPTSRVMDERLEWRFEGKVWSPSNYEEKFYGEVTVREALEHSLNSATARIAKDIGIRPIRDLAVRLGMDPGLLAFPAIVLGGWEVPLFDLAKVFTVFANGGMGARPLGVKTVTDRAGATLEGNHLEIERIVPATDAYMVTHMLAGVMERGTGAVARRKGFRHPAAGKTGTSNDFRDAWFVGYTPDLLTVVWVGLDRGASMGLAGSEAALPIWTDFMRQALADHPHTSFDVPPGIELRDVDRPTGMLARPGCRGPVVREAFLSGEEPTEYCSPGAGL